MAETRVVPDLLLPHGGDRRRGGVLSWRIWHLRSHVVVAAAANSMAAGAGCSLVLA
jgi:hypothetical protein